MSEKTHADIIAEMRIFKCRDLSTGELEECTAISKYLADRIEAAHEREVDALKQRCAELNAEVVAKDEVIKRLNDAISEEQRRKMATAENSSAVGNAAKLRDALVQVQKKINYLIGNLTVPNSLVANRMEVNGIINAALAAPARNCEVGTAMEQGERFSAYCRAHKHPESECLPCPLFGQTGGYCELAWAQLTYKKGETK